jgi:dethiobiotin synthetase
MKTIVVAGTATDVGKTWVTAQLLTRLRSSGVHAVARKPVQSFEVGAPEPTDADVLASAAGEEPHDVCPPHRWLSLPMAPPMAANALGLPELRLADLCAEIVWPDREPDLGFVEAVGGVRSPLADDGDTVELALQLRADLVLLVADAGLGVIDNVRLAAEALAPTPTVVFLNRFDSSDLHKRNLAWLRDRDELDVVTDLDELVELFS